jgi:hypothetical protein
MKEDWLYSPTALNLKESRRWNLEKYHMYSMILELLGYVKGDLKEEWVNIDDIEIMFLKQGFPRKGKKLEAKINAALAQLIWMGYITCDKHSVRLTDDGVKVYKEQRFHAIAADLYNAENTKRLSIIAIVVASILSMLAIAATILGACLS